MYTELLQAQQSLYQPNQLTIHNFALQPESSEYHAATFTLNQFNIIYRLAKITPTKNGQFVAIWQRNKHGITEPFDQTTIFDYIIIAAQTTNNFGQFIFPKSILLQHDCISKNHIGGKRGMRIYPPWDQPESKQAAMTQHWQLPYFVTPDNQKKLLGILQKV